MAQSSTWSVLVAHPSPDLYGSDLQVLETVEGLRAQGARVVVALPHEGPLAALLREGGARVLLIPMPVLQRSLLAPRALVPHAARTVRTWWSLHRFLRRHRPDALLVNTMTVPVWLLAAGTARVPAVLHVHEAEQDAPRVIRTLLASQLGLARIGMVNSAAAREALLEVAPWLRSRLRLLYNGVPGPSEPVGPPPGGPTARLALVGRLSPRKGTDVALEATALLRERGHAVHLDLYGAVFPGYEWFEESLRRRAGQRDLRGTVTFHGYVRPVWRSLEAANIVLVPSRTEPFGNVAVEAQLAGRPVVVSAVQGLREIVTDGETGLLADPGSARSLANAIESLLHDRERAGHLAAAGRFTATRRFSVERYRREAAAYVRSVAAR